jgi:hypothetical protein
VTAPLVINAQMVSLIRPPPYVQHAQERNTA